MKPFLLLPIGLTQDECGFFLNWVIGDITVLWTSPFIVLDSLPSLPQHFSAWIINQSTSFWHLMGVPDNLADTSPACCPAKISIYVTKLHFSEMDGLGVQSATWEGYAYHRGCILQFLVDAEFSSSSWARGCGRLMSRQLEWKFQLLVTWPQGTFSEVFRRNHLLVGEDWIKFEWQQMRFKDIQNMTWLQADVTMLAQFGCFI